MPSYVEGADPMSYWTRWQFPVCALIVVVPAAAACAFISRYSSDPLRSSDLWKSCWIKIHPRWLLLYRAFVCFAMSYILFSMLFNRGVSAFYFYTQWTFALVVVYFTIATVISAHGCWICSRGYVQENKEMVKRLLEMDFEANLPATFTSRTHEDDSTIKLQNYFEQGEDVQIAGFSGCMMQIIYQTCGGAVLLTDLVFWSFLVPFTSSEYFKLTPMKGCIHSLNLAFLLLDTALNRLRFPFFRIAYFVLWSFLYVIFQWILHAYGFRWWPYPFLDLTIPSAPIWYLCTALLHIPCYGIYAALVKAKDSICSKYFPQAYYVRS